MRANKKAFYREAKALAKSTGVPYRIAKKALAPGMQAFEDFLKFQVSQMMINDFKKGIQQESRIIRQIKRESETAELEGLWKTIFGQSETNR